jgi:hypothetical protein
MKLTLAVSQRAQSDFVVAALQIAAPEMGLVKLKCHFRPFLERHRHVPVDHNAAVEGGWYREDFSGVTHVIEQRIGRKLSRQR